MIIDIHAHVCAAPELYQWKANQMSARGAHGSTTLGFPEIDRCVKDLGFIGLLIDTDPGEGDNSTPTLGDEYWYPLWEKMVQLDLPGLIHSTGCKHGRENYSQHFITEESLAILSIVNSNVLQDFPMFGTENPGSGSAPNPETGKPFDDIKPLIDAIQTLTDEDRRNIFEDNARRLFSRLKIPRTQDAAQTVSR